MLDPTNVIDTSSFAAAQTNREDQQSGKKFILESSTPIVESDYIQYSIVESY